MVWYEDPRCNHGRASFLCIQGQHRGHHLCSRRRLAYLAMSSSLLGLLRRFCTKFTLAQAMLKNLCGFVFVLFHGYALILMGRSSRNSSSLQDQSLFSGRFHDIPDYHVGKPPEVQEKTCIHRPMPTCSCTLRALSRDSRELLDTWSCMNHPKRSD